MNHAISNFLKLESASGILLMLSALAALILANSLLSGYYTALLDIPVHIRIGALTIDKPLLLWINDGLMAVFFFVIGLELKREFVEGELSDPQKIILPALGAIGGMAMPAIIYLLVNKGDPLATSGWAIPAATDIAFALGVLALLGSRVPSQLKIFLVSLAIFDDVGAIIIIALFYTSDLSAIALGISLSCIGVLAFLNWRGSLNISLYLLVGLIMWVALLKSGIHATLAGVVLAAFIPMIKNPETGQSPLHALEHDLHGSVSYIILPVFAFVNAGVSLQGMTLDQILGPVPVGIALGLVIGKQIGVFGICWLGIKLGIAKLPDEVSWSMLYGVAILCGIGFTMSMFIGSLAFEEANSPYLYQDRIGILGGSFIAALLGYFWLRRTLPRAA
ncbi:Na+/H+ antiporter NhaA type [hydrothermal vent metagenome]|uniref:Na+/H+ antiporter NhaA type n=1 Tax=hydrothermal vent metagenome TaxID=652676 RepID=A0A3B0YF22_9ZZZZ